MANEHFLQLVKLLFLAPLPDEIVVGKLGLADGFSMFVGALLGELASGPAAAAEYEGLNVGPSVVPTDIAVANELRVDAEELLVNELADIVTGTDDATN